MPKSSKPSDQPDIQQINFFSEEDQAENDAVEYTDGEGEAVSGSEAVTETDDMPFDDGDPSLTSDAIVTEDEHTVESVQESSQAQPSAEVEHSSPEDSTEILESEIMPEDSVEAALLTPSDTPVLREADTLDEDGTEELQEANAKPPKKRRAPGSLKRESILVHLITLVAEFIVKALRNCFLASLLTAYDRTAELFRSSKLYSFFTRRPAAFFKSLKKTVRRHTTDSGVPKKLAALSSSLLSVRSRIYGLILFAFAVSSLFVHFFVNLYFTISVFSVYTPVIAIGVAIASMFLIFSKKTLAGTLLESRIFSAISFKLLGINKNSLSDRRAIELSASGAIILGLIFGLITMFFPIQSVLIFLLYVIYTVVVIKSPETGLISLFLIAPFASLGALTGAILIITASYLFKVLCGKRTLSLEFPDLFVGMFTIMILFGGAVTFGEKSSVLTYLLFTGIYFIAASILRSSVWFVRGINAILLSGAVVSVYAVITRLFGEKLGFTLDLTKETDVGDASAGILSSFSVLSCFVLILGIFLLASLLTCKKKSQRFLLIIVNICTLVFLFMTLPSGAWLAAVAAYVIILLLWKSRTALYMIIACLFFPFLPALKIYSVENFFSSIINETNRYDLWNAVMRMLTDFGIGGIGLGENAFSSVYSAYFIGNTENALHTGSLIMQILISFGIFGLIVFAAIVFFILQSSLSYGKSCSDKSDFNRITCYAGMCGIIAFFLWGMNEFIWFNPRVMLLFWLIAGVTVSARRSALDLETSDRETNLYGDTYLE